MRKTIFTVLLVIWVAFIFSMSSQDSKKSSNTSGSTIKVVLSTTVPEFKEQPKKIQDRIVEELQFITRKSAHFIAYMVLGILAILTFLQYEKINKKPLFAFLLCVAYAISDEVHQLFVPGRAGQIRDVAIDSLGSIVGIALVLLFIKLLKSIRKEKLRIISS